MTLTKPDAIIFDWDNTLVDTWPTIHEALNHTLAGMGHPEWPIEKVRSEVKKSMRDAFPAMFGEQWEEAAQHYQDYYRSIHLTNLQFLPQADAVLNALRRHDVFLAVVSNKRGVNLRKEIDHLGWNGYFDAVVGADDAAFDKPHAAPVEMALGQGDIALGDSVWFIGDTIIDLECAQNTNTVPILYGPVETDGGQYLGFPFRHHARDHAALLRVIEQVFVAAAA